MRKSFPTESGQRLTEILAQLGARPGSNKVTLGEIMSALAGRAHAACMLFLVLPETIPLPLPSLSLVLGLPLIALAAHLLVFGEAAALPGRLNRVSVPTAALQTVLSVVGPWLKRVEALTHPRWEHIASQQRLIGAVCLLLAIVLELPVPFFNLAPALCLATIALGAVQRDGLLIGVGFGMTIVLAGATAVLILALLRTAELIVTP